MVYRCFYVTIAVLLQLEFQTVYYVLITLLQNFLFLSLLSLSGLIPGMPHRYVRHSQKYRSI
nr:MAG TPA: hypothetical protein [Caudoviricetes sp.]